VSERAVQDRGAQDRAVQVRALAREVQAWDPAVRVPAQVQGVRALVLEPAVLAREASLNRPDLLRGVERRPSDK
jgi:hypothetical protein